MRTIINTDWPDVVGSVGIQVGTINVLLQEGRCSRVMERIRDYFQHTGEEAVYGTCCNVMRSCFW